MVPRNPSPGVVARIAPDQTKPSGETFKRLSTPGCDADCGMNQFVHEDRCDLCRSLRRGHARGPVE